MSTVFIQGGRVIDPASGFDATADVLIVDGIVREISSHRGELTTASRQSGTHVIDAEGCIVSPGLVDIHVHFREPGYEETWE